MRKKQPDKRVHLENVERKENQTNDGWIERWMAGQTDRRIDKPTDGRMDRLTDP